MKRIWKFCQYISNTCFILYFYTCYQNLFYFWFILLLFISEKIFISLINKFIFEIGIFLAWCKFKSMQNMIIVLFLTILNKIKIILCDILLWVASVESNFAESQSKKCKDPFIAVRFLSPCQESLQGNRKNSQIYLICFTGVARRTLRQIIHETLTQSLIQRVPGSSPFLLDLFFCKTVSATFQTKDLSRDNCYLM